MDFSNRFKIFCLGSYILFSLTLGVTMLLVNKEKAGEKAAPVQAAEVVIVPADSENPPNLITLAQLTDE